MELTRNKDPFNQEILLIRVYYSGPLTSKQFSLYRQNPLFQNNKYF